MATISTLSVQLTADTSPFARGMSAAKGHLVGFRASVSNAGAGIVQTFATIGLAVQGVKTVFGTLAAVASTPVKLAAAAEQTAVSFEVLTGSVDNAKAVLADLKTFAASTPFQFTDLADAGKKLIAFGTASRQVAPTLKRLGELSAGLNIPIGELSEIYGKARVQGRLFMEDINQLAGRGIPIQTELAKIFGVTGEEVRNLVSSGQVNFGHLEESIKSLTEEGGKFNGLIQKQSQTLSGVWSTLKDNVGEAMTQIGEAIANGFNLKGIVSSMTTWVQDISKMFQMFSMDWNTTWEIMGLKVQSVMAQVVAVVRSEFDNLGESTEGFFRGLYQGVQRFGFFGIRMSDNHWLNEADRNTRIEGLQTQQRTILERSERAGSVSEEDAAAFRRIQAEIDKIQGVNTAFGNEVHRSRKQWEKAARAADEASKPFEDRISKLMEGLRERFEASRSVGVESAADSMAREMAAKVQSQIKQAAAPGTLERNSVEAFRAIARWNQPKSKTERLEEKQVQLLQRIADELEGPVEFVDLD